MTPWLDAVAEFGRRAWSAHVDWMVVGSAASAMQGARVEPADVDILVRRPSDVALLAGHLYDLAVREAVGRDRATFLSSIPEPLLWYHEDGWSWTFGRWQLGDMRVEVAHIDGPPADLVETRGDRIWEVRRDVTLNGVTTPCVPLEVQVATAMHLGDEDRRYRLTDALLSRHAEPRLLVESLLGRGFRPHTLGPYPDVLMLLPPGMRPTRA
ncbi:MAG TPA: hypothetical protein GXZ45_01440 [Propionibacterium sp.]|nr:hypothetical protein [Propionibacterium sp.]